MDSLSEKGGQEGCNAQEAPARSRRSDEERRRRCRQNQAQWSRHFTYSTILHANFQKSSFFRGFSVLSPTTIPCPSKWRASDTGPSSTTPMKNCSSREVWKFFRIIYLFSALKLDDKMIEKLQTTVSPIDIPVVAERIFNKLDVGKWILKEI